MELRRGTLVVFMLLLMSVFGITITVLPVDVKAAALYVGGSGPGNYTAIQNAIDAASPGDTIFVYNGTYQENLVIGKILTLNGEDRNTTFVDGGDAGTVISVNVDWVNISGFTVIDSGLSSGDVGIGVYDSEHCHISDNNISSNRQGVHLKNTNGCTLVGNVLGNNSIYIESSNNNIIANSIFVDRWATVFIGYSDNNLIVNNTLYECDSCIWIDASTNVSVINNTISSVSTFGIHAFSSWRLTITDNRISGGITGLLLWSLMQSNVTYNILTANYEEGIVLDLSSQYNNVTRNNITSSGGGIKASYYSDFNNIANNSILSNGNVGICVEDSGNNTIARNNISGNKDGIQLFLAKDNTIERNNITSNDRDGISFSYSDRNVIKNNTIESNERFGLYANWSFNNEIYHNNITNNSQQAFDDTDTNLWDNGYPSGGNNWSDYIGMDDFSGPNQDVLGSDGIGDTPYTIDADSRDRYPFYVYTPFSLPSEPRFLSATPGNHQISLSWLAPLSDGGSPVTNYTIYRGIASGGEVFLVEIGNVTGYTDTGLANGQEYFYQVSAVNIVGEGPKSNEASAIPFDPSSPPSPPRNLQATPGDREVDLAWEPPLDDGGWPIINYRVYRGLTPAGISFLDEIGNVTNYTDTGLTNGQTYYYEVSALNWIGESIPRSNMASATPGAVPGPPVGLIAVPGDGEIALSWTEPADDGGFPVANYRIYRGLMPGTEVFLVEIGNITIHIDTGLLNDLTYYYKVSAVNSLGEGPLSNEANATPTAAMTEPTEPLNLVAFPGDGEVLLAWDPPWFDGNSPVLGYRIYRGTIPGGEVFLVDVGNVTVHNDPGLINGQTYYYKVSAVNGVGEGAMSNEAWATPSSAPGAPNSPMAELIGIDWEDMRISWSLSDDDGAGQGTVVGYSVYRNSTYSAEGIDYQLIATLPDGTTEVIDPLVGEGDPNNYFYRICAVDLNNRTECSFYQVGKFTRYLSQGNNLLSVPLIQQDGGIDSVLRTVQWDRAWAYDSSSSTWRSNHKSKPYQGGLQTLDHMMAFWISVTQDSNFTVAGIVPAQTSITLFAGWNLVGFPSFNSSYTVGDLKIVTGATHVEGYDASSPPYFLKALVDSDTLHAGHGYWVYVPADAVWTVSNR